MQLRWRRAAKERAKRRSRKKRNKNLLIHFHLAYRTNSHPLECRRWIWGFSKPTTIDSKKKHPKSVRTVPASLQSLWCITRKLFCITARWADELSICQLASKATATMRQWPGVFALPPVWDLAIVTMRLLLLSLAIIIGSSYALPLCSPAKTIKSSDPRSAVGMIDCKY